MASPTCTPKNGENHNVESKGYKTKLTTLESSKAKTRQRRRTESKAIKFLDDSIKLPPIKRSQFIKRIRRSYQPYAEAKRIALTVKLQLIKGIGKKELDLSDVQELRVKLIRRDGGIFPPQTDCLSKLEIQIIEGDISKKEFQETAAEILNMSQCLSKACFLFEEGN